MEDSRALPLRTAWEVAVANDDIVKHPDAEHVAHLAQAIGDMQVFSRWCRITTRMVTRLGRLVV
jgi:hypothetical protein